MAMQEAQRLAVQEVQRLAVQEAQRWLLPRHIQDWVWAGVQPAATQGLCLLLRDSALFQERPA